MSQELHYTSVPRGLKPGARGFCTVASTTGLSPTLAERLEGLSGYRAAFPPDHPQASLNPVAWSHVRISSVGQTLSVISRVGPAGLDYTDRPNKYAHHIVLESSERAPGGPAWVLEQPGFMATEWDGPPQQIATGRRPTPGDRPGGICRAWAERTGDAGWGGVLAEAFLADSKRQVVVVFDPGVNVLPLFGEAIALLPADLRWEVTFQSYFTGLPPGITCLWRAVLRDTAEERQARGNPDSLIVDLAAAGRAIGGSLVYWARTGEAPVTLAPAPTVRPAVQAPKPEVIPPQPSSPRRVVPVAPEPASPDPYGLAPPPAPRSLRSSRTAPSPEARESARTSVWPMIAVSLLAFMLGGGFGGTVVYLIMQSRISVAKIPVVELTDANPELLRRPDAPRESVEQSKKDESASPIIPAINGPEDKMKRETAKDAPAPKPKSETQQTVLADRKSDTAISAKKIDSAGETHKKAEAAVGAGIGEASPPHTDGIAPKPEPKILPLKFLTINSAPNPTTIPEEQRTIVGLSLVGGNDPRWGQYRIQPVKNQQDRSLRVTTRINNEESPVGLFTWGDHSVKFKWLSEGPSSEIQESFRNCILEIDFSDQPSEYYLLRQPAFLKAPKRDQIGKDKKFIVFDWIEKENVTNSKWADGVARISSLSSLTLKFQGGQRIEASESGSTAPPATERILASKDSIYAAKFTSDKPPRIRLDFKNPKMPLKPQKYSELYKQLQQLKKLPGLADASYQQKMSEIEALLNASDDLDKKLTDFSNAGFEATVIIEVDGMKFHLVDVNVEPK